MSVSQRKQLAKSEHEFALAAAGASSDEDSESGEAPASSSGFAMLSGTAVAAPAASGAKRNAKKKNKARKKAAAPIANADAQAMTTSIAAVPVTGKKSAAKKAAKASVVTAPSKGSARRAAKQKEMDELDALLAEVNTAAAVPKAKTKKRPGTVATPSPAVNAAPATLMSVNLRFLDSAMELKAMFGTKLPPRNGPTTYMAHRGASWPDVRPLMRLERLGMQADGAVVYGFRWGEPYELAEKEFLACVKSNQPNAFVLLLQRWGYHAGALLQLVALSQRSGQYEQAYDLLSRALYFFERNMTGSFRLDDCNARLPYAHRENQALHVALFKWCLMLARKGCVRTALECAKVLLNWDPLDPLDVLLLVDVFALRSRQYQWLVDLYDRGIGNHKHLHRYPNLAYGCAFALFHLDQPQRAEAQLVRALSAFPECAASIFQALQIESGFRSLAHFCAPQSQAAELDRVCKLYCARSKDMWRQRTLQEWVSKVAATMVVEQVLRDETIAAYVMNDSLRLPRMAKHMMLSEEELEGNAGHIPLAMLQEALNLDALDMPPQPDSEVAMARLMGSDAYGEDEPEPETRHAATANAVALFLHSLMPWNEAPNAPPLPVAAQPENWFERARVLLGLPLLDNADAAPRATAAAARRGARDSDDDDDDEQQESSHTDDET